MEKEISFKMANVLVEETADLDLSFGERMLYLYLGNMVQYGKDTLSDKFLANKIGTNERQIRRMKETLKEKGFISWSTTKNKKDRFNSPSKYTVFYQGQNVLALINTQGQNDLASQGQNVLANQGQKCKNTKDKLSYNTDNIKTNKTNSTTDKSNTIVPIDIVPKEIKKVSIETGSKPGPDANGTGSNKSNDNEYSKPRYYSYRYEYKKLSDYITNPSEGKERPIIPTLTEIYQVTDDEGNVLWSGTADQCDKCFKYDADLAYKLSEIYDKAVYERFQYLENWMSAYLHPSN